MNANDIHTPVSSRIAEGASRMLRSRLFLGVGLALMLGATGCQARAMTAAEVDVEEPVMEVETVPVAIETYPRHYYHGAYVYLVDGRWYHRRHGHWVVYTVEPRVLADVRVSYQAKVGARASAGAAIASPAHAKGHARGHRKH